MLTIAGNFWPREIDFARFPATRVEYAIDPRTKVVAYEHKPSGPPCGQIVFLHGLEGSADAPPRLLKAAVDSGANLLVAGAFGHPRLQEFVFGGATRTFFAAAAPSLFISH